MVSEKGADGDIKVKSGQGSTVIAVVGLGYVGLPLAEAFSRYFDVIGFDVNVDKVKRIAQDAAFEVSSDPSVLSRADVVILAVPTPISRSKEPARQTCH